MPISFTNHRNNTWFCHLKQLESGETKAPFHWKFVLWGSLQNLWRSLWNPAKKLLAHNLILATFKVCLGCHYYCWPLLSKRMDQVGSQQPPFSGLPSKMTKASGCSPLAREEGGDGWTARGVACWRRRHRLTVGEVIAREEEPLMVPSPRTNGV